MNYDKKPTMLWLWARIAIGWLRRSPDEGKKELINLPWFILKAERKWKYDPNAMVVIESTFSIHRKIEGGYWQYVKYQVDNNNHYSFLRAGKYPYAWE